MKVLFLGDYSALHATWAAQLRRMGHSVDVVSDGGVHMLTPADTLLKRAPGRWGSVRYLYDIFSLLPRWRGYDVVQLINPGFLKLRPGRLAYLFRRLKEANGKVCLTLAGNDHYFVKSCLEPGFFRFSQYRVGAEPTPFSRENRLNEEQYVHPLLARYTSLIYENVDAAMSTLYEYHVAAAPHLGERLHFVGMPVDLEAIPFSPMPEAADGRVGLFIGMIRGREVEKGTDRLLRLAQQLEAEMPGRCRVVQATSLPLKDYLALMRGSHIVFDQLYSYSPALNALDAMAMGRVAVSGAQPEVYDFIGERDNRPVVCASPLATGMADELRGLILSADRLRQAGEASRRYAEKHHDARVITRKLVDIWEKL